MSYLGRVLQVTIVQDMTCLLGKSVSLKSCYCMYYYRDTTFQNLVLRNENPGRPQSAILNDIGDCFNRQATCRLGLCAINILFLLK